MRSTFPKKGNQTFYRDSTKIINSGDDRTLTLRIALYCVYQFVYFYLKNCLNYDQFFENYEKIKNTI